MRWLLTSRIDGAAIIPNFFTIGVLAIIVGVITLTWARIFVQTKCGDIKTLSGEDTS